jgi:hypothetical protein
MLWKGIQSQQLHLGHSFHGLQAGYRWPGRASAEVEIELLRRQVLVIDRDVMSLASRVGHDGRLAVELIKTRNAGQPVVE